MEKAVMDNPLDFSGQNVFVVGGSSGIGNGIAHGFRRQGARVFVAGTRTCAADYLGEAGSDLGGLEYCQLDVASLDAIDKFTPPFAQLDVLVLSQGIIFYDGLEFDPVHFRKVIDVNLVSLMGLCAKFFPLLKASSCRDGSGSVVVISSTAAFHSTPENPAYNASKTGAFGLTRTLGQAWAREGVRVNGIAPGLIDTRLTKYTVENPEKLAANLQKIPLGRLGETADIANVALFLASPLSAYMVGETLTVDGGRILE